MANVQLNVGVGGVLLATNRITRDGVQEDLELINISDPTSGACAPVDAANGLKVQVSTGSLTAIVTEPYSETVDAQTATAGSAVGLVAFNGVTCDRLRVDAAKNLLVALGAAVPAGANIIGAVNPPTASGQVLASAAQTANGNSAALNVGAFRHLDLFLNFSATSGTNQTITVFVQSQDPVSSNWSDIASWNQIQGNGTNVLLPPNALSAPVMLAIPDSIGMGNQLRVRWEVGGTSPSFTFSVGYVGK